LNEFVTNDIVFPNANLCMFFGVICAACLDVQFVNITIIFHDNNFFPLIIIFLLIISFMISPLIIIFIFCFHTVFHLS